MDAHADWHQSHAPHAPSEQLLALSEKHWGLNGGIEPLYGERDLNARLRTHDGKSWLLKLSHPDTTRARLSFENRVLEALALQPRAPIVPRLLRTQEGQATVPVDLDDGRTTRLRILGWLPGESLLPERASPATLESLGAACAQLNEALAASDLPPNKGALPRDLPWDLQNAHVLDALLPHCPPVVPGDAVRRVLGAYRDTVATPLARMHRQVVHNDLNPENVRFDSSRPEAVPGIIDFGDMVEAPVVSDLAIACAYVIGTEPNRCLDRVISVLRGFERERTLESSEWQVLPTLLALRLCQSLTIQGARVGDGHPNSPGLEQELHDQARRLLALQACTEERWAQVRSTVRS